LAAQLSGERGVAGGSADLPGVQAGRAIIANRDRTKANKIGRLLSFGNIARPQPTKMTTARQPIRMPRAAATM
jgi:hypothetical protein